VWTRFFLCFLGAALLTSAASRSQEKISYRVAGDRLKCVLDNYQQYLNTGKDLLTIDANLCPNLPVESSGSTGGIPAFSEDFGNQPDRLIVLTVGELKCMAESGLVDDEEAVYDVVPEDCSIRKAP
jgi:hypothetical protein